MSQEKEEMRAFVEKTLVRCVREDKDVVACSKFIVLVLGQVYIEPISSPCRTSGPIRLR